MVDEALARQRDGDSGEAMALLKRAVSAGEASARAHYALGCLLQEAGDRGAAVASYLRTLEIESRHVAAHLNLGVLLQTQGDTEGALEHFRLATSLEPQNPDAWINLAFVLERRRELARARDCYDRALDLDPGNVDARFNRSMVLLAQGDYARGWQDYEWRWQASGFPRPDHSQPEWDGNALHGETLLVYTEQGFGDAIQFVRYAALAAERGARVVLRCPPELQRLLGTVAGVSETVLPGQAVTFDCHSALLSLPRLLGTRLETIPAHVPYIRADPQLMDDWRLRLGGESPGKKVGLVWASRSMMPNAARKSMTLSTLAPLAGIQGARYFSLQMGGAGEQDAGGASFRFDDPVGGIRDFADTAALIANMDLVISVDTAVAHLAGAMGKPAWTLLQYAPDWRWYPDAPTSNWYPGMRLYRQRVPGDWEGVCADVARDLDRLAAGAPAISRT
jgi:Flp pilus assembly protein TadD